MSDATVTELAPPPRAAGEDQPLDGMPEPPAAPTAEAEAPFGRRADGTPRRKPGRPRSNPASTPRPRKPSARSGSSSRGTAAGPDYAGAIRGLLAIPAGALALAAASVPGGQGDDEPPLKAALRADSETVLVYGPPLAEALDQVAREDPRTAAVLDRILTVGPWGGVFAVVVPMVVQFAANHRLVRAGTMGTLDAQQLHAAATGQPPAAAAA